jgi:hypothetical protein
MVGVCIAFGHNKKHLFSKTYTDKNTDYWRFLIYIVKMTGSFIVQQIWVDPGCPLMSRLYSGKLMSTSLSFLICKFDIMALL